ncbi:MAG: sulfotransferase family 2 domain-containing protein [Planctomycetaceae bacterium]
MHLVVYEPWRLVYAPLPKCASTTMINLLLDASGMPARRGPRDCPRKTAAQVGRGATGVYELRLEGDEIAAVARRLAAYTWFSVTRDPFARVESNYRNKLNRYARRFHPLAYLASYATPVRLGTSVEAWQAARINTMQKVISFEQFVHGLARHGTEWDPHFAPQVRVLELDRVRFDRLIDMEQLAAGLESLFRSIGRLASVRGSLEALRHDNASRSADVRSLWTPQLRAVVADLYHDDFAGLEAATAGRRAA